MPSRKTPSPRRPVGHRSGSRSGSKRPGNSRPLLFEQFEDRRLLAVGVFGESQVWLPAIPATATTPGTVDPCGQFIVTFCQYVRGTVPDSDTYRFFADHGDIVASFEYSSDTATAEAKLQKPESGVGWHTLSVSGSGAKYEVDIYNIRVPGVDVVSQWDDPYSGSLGPFLYSVPLQNRFDIKFPVSLPSELTVQYRVGDKGSWQDGTSFTLDVGTLPAGQTSIDVQILDPENRRLYFYDNEAYIDVIDDLPYDLRFTDRPDSPQRNTWNADQVRFLDGVNAGLWQAEVLVDYVPVYEAYKNYDFELTLVSAATGTQTIFGARFNIGAGEGKTNATTLLRPHELFHDVVLGPNGIDYHARLRATRVVNNQTVFVSKPFTTKEPIFATTLPKWMGDNPVATYELTDVLGKQQYAYAIKVDRLTLDKSLPTTSGTPFKLFDDLDTNLNLGVNVRVYASPDIGQAPQARAESWSAQVTVLDRELINASGGEFFPKSGVHVSATLEPKLLGLDGGGILITADPRQVSIPSFATKFKPFVFRVPVVWAGVAGIAAKLEIGGEFTMVPRNVSLQASLHIVEKNGRIVFERDSTFVRLNLNATSTLTLDGQASLGITAGFTPPVGLSDADKQALKNFELDLISFIAKGTATANLDGLVQANFYDGLRDLKADFDETNVTLSGSLKLKYDSCLINNDTLRDLLQLKPCGDPSTLKALYDTPFGPATILGKNVEEADPNQPDSHKKQGTGISAGTDSGGEGEHPSSSEPPFPTAELRGSIRFDRPFDHRLRKLDYRFEATGELQTPSAGKYFLDAVLMTDDGELVVDRVDLATLSFSATGSPDRFTSGAIERTVMISDETLHEDRLYRLEFRLFHDTETAEVIDVALQQLDTANAGPLAMFDTPTGSLDDGELNFGPDTDSTITAELTIDNAGDRSLNIDSIELVGTGFALVNPTPGPVAILPGAPVTFRIRLLDPSKPATASLRLVTNDPEQETIEIPLNYDTADSLNTTPPETNPPRSAPFPSLSPLGNQTLHEGTPLTVSLTASDPTPGDGLVFWLTEGPAFATIDAATGLITWNPPEDFAGGIYTFTARVVEPSDAQLFDTRSFEVALRKTNQSPVFAAIPDQTIRPGETLQLKVFAGDSDLPAQALSYQLDPEAPAGAAIDSLTGRFQWTPASTTATGSYEIPLRVTDNGSPAKTTLMSFFVNVLDTNVRPELAPIPPVTVDEGELIEFTAQGSDVDGDSLTYRLAPGAPAGANIDPQTGDFAWTPGEEQGGVTHAMRVEVVDGRDASLIDYQIVFIEVRELNTPAIINLPETVDVAIGSETLLETVIDDADMPPTFKVYALVGDVPDGARIHPLTGEFSWTPATEGNFPITFQVTDYLHPLTVEVQHTVTFRVGPDTEPPEVTLYAFNAYQTPFIFGEVTDNIGVTSLAARFIEPAMDFTDVSAALDDAGFFTLEQADLEQLLGDSFSGDASYTIELRFADAAGNSASVQQQFAIDFSPPLPVPINLVPAFDTAPVGDRATTHAVVDLVAQTEPLAAIQWLSDEGGSLGQWQADASGLLTITDVSLHLGRNRLYWQLSDTAGNSEYFDTTVTRWTADGMLGPDSFGHLAQLVAPAFDDISSSGQLLIAAGESTGQLTAADLDGFQFTLHGRTYDEVHVTADGLIKFSSDMQFPPSFGFLSFPSEPVVAAFWSEAYVPDDGGVFWQVNDVTGGQQLVVQWRTATDVWTGDDFITDSRVFQAILDSRDGSIQFNFQDLLPDEASDYWDTSVVGLGYGNELFPDIGSFALAAGNAPFDLIRAGASVQVTRAADTLGPLLHAELADAMEGHVTTAPSISGVVADVSGLAALHADFDPALPPATFDLLPIVQSDGSFVLDTADLAGINGGQLPDGEYLLRFTAVDTHDNESTTTIRFVLDTTGPLIERFELRRTSDSPPLRDHVTDRAEVEFDGITEPLAFIELSGPFGQESTLADEDGLFSFSGDSFSRIGLELGTNTLLLKAFDALGNESTQELTLTRIEGDSVGPDAFGYWARAVTPEFIDIEATGTRVLVGEDDAKLRLTPSELNGFAFRFYGVLYDSLELNSNGSILFGDNDDFSSSTYISISPENPTIAPFGFDLVIGGAPDSGVVWQVRDDSGDKQLIVQWNKVFDTSGNGPLTFQAVLSMAEGTIQLNYDSVGTGEAFVDFPQSSIGIKDVGDQSDVGRFLELSPLGAPTALVASGVSTLITNELITVGPPRVTSYEPERTTELSEIVFHFDRVMDLNSFSVAEDVASFQGPNGDLKSAITGFAWLDNRTLRLTFAAQTAEGSYTLVLNPTMTAPPTGLAIDQDADGVPGELEEDQFTATVELDRCVGPDAAGYKACAVRYEEIDLEPNMPGVFVIAENSDDGFAPLDLGGHTLRFYDHVITGPNSLYVSVNGLLTVGTPHDGFELSDLATTPLPATIAPLWDDWTTAFDQADLVLGKFEDTTGDDVADRLIIEWSQLSHYFGDFTSGRGTFQAILELNSNPQPSKITFNYVNLRLDLDFVSDPDERATVGIKNTGEAGGERLLVSHAGDISALVGSRRAIEIVSLRPSASLSMAAESPRVTPVSHIQLAFDRDVTGVDVADLSLTYHGEPIPLDGVSISGSGAAYVIEISSVTQPPGEYRMALNAASSGITDASGLSLFGDAQVTWTLATENHAPTDITLSNSSVAENQPGAPVGTLSAIDLNIEQTHTWTVSDRRFEVIAGQLRVVAGATLDFENEPEIELLITATDSGTPSLAFSKQLTITVLDNNDAPAAVQLSLLLAVERLSGASVGTLLAVDQDSSQMHQFAITDQRFEVAAGVLKLKDDQFLDDEVELLLEVTASDAGSPAAELTRRFHISVAPNPFPWTNPDRRLDTNRDNSVTPIDALLIVNLLNDRVSLGAGGILPRSRPASSKAGYFDTNRDGFATPLDALLVVNFLNGGVEAESEASLAAASESTDATWLPLAPATNYAQTIDLLFASPAPAGADFLVGVPAEGSRRLAGELARAPLYFQGPAEHDRTRHGLKALMSPLAFDSEQATARSIDRALDECLADDLISERW